MKDEANDYQIVECYSLRSKAYTYIKSNEYESKKLKGIKKSVIKQDINAADYKNCIVN